MLDNRVIQEMIQTEKTYNGSLELLENSLEQAFFVAENSAMANLKGLITPLKHISDALLFNITATNVEYNETELSKFKAQRTQLLKAFFNAYQSYAAAFDLYIKENQTNPEQFREWDNFIRENNNKCLNLADYLVQPLQRGPRYAILVDAALKNSTHLQDIHLGELQQLAAQIRECLLSANSSRPAQEAKGYQFGDISRSLLRRGSTYLAASSIPVEMPIQQQEISPEEIADTKPVYKFGDVTRLLVGGLWKKEAPLPTTPVTVPPAEEVSMSSTSSDDENDDETQKFVFLG